MSLALWVAGGLYVTGGLYAAGGLSAACALLAGHTAVNAALLRRPATSPSTVDFPVSVLLPLRDEAHRVRACLEALLRQRGVPGLEIVVLDDQSTDDTAGIVRAIAGHDRRVRLVAGAPTPPGWLGKPYACHQLAAHASPAARVLVFVDADVVLTPDAIAAAVGILDGFDVASPYPRLLAEGAGERLVQPLLAWSWLTFLPLRAMERSRRPSLAAAGGQFLAVTTAGYQRAGGHAAVRDRVLEDIELARTVKRAGGRITLANGSRMATCRMYTSWRGLVDGYSKSLWASFGSPGTAATVVGMLVLLYAAPPALAIIAALGGLWGAAGAWSVAATATVAYLLGVAGRVVTGTVTGSRVWPDALAHPASVVVFAWLVARSYRACRRGTLTWKGRPVSPASPASTTSPASPTSTR
jgi:GT2 family glycosyltransferase